MTTSQSRNLRKAGAVALSLALAMSTLAITPASAAKKVKLAKTKITVNVGKTKTVKIKNIKKKQVKKLTVKSKSTKIAKAKASKKTAIKVTGKKAGSTKVTANLKLKKKVNGKKAYKLTLKVTVKKAATPTEAPVPTVAPTAAPTPVVTAAAVSIENAATGYKVATGQSVTIRANLTPATSNEEVSWASSDTTKAVVSGTAATVNGVSTVEILGVAIGEVDITAKISNGQTATTKLTVTKNEIYANIVSAEQVGDQFIKVNYDKDLKEDTMGYDRTKVKVTMYQTDGKTEANVFTCKKEVRSADGKSATYTLDGTLFDKRHVKVEYGSTSGEFDTKIGEPVTAKVITTEAQKDVPTKLEYALIDANTMDVTATYAVNGAVTLSITGVATENVSSDPVNGTFTMDKVGEKATATVNYTKVGNTSGKPDITQTGSIVCIPTQATVGTGHYRVDDEKVWKGDSKDVTVDVDGTREIWFYATDDNGDAIKYDSWEAEAANKQFLSVSVEGDSGKYVHLTASGNQVGPTFINIKATKNGVATPYSIPITVRAAGALKRIEAKASRTSMTNAYDEDYTSEITVTAYDTNDKKITNGYTLDYKVIDEDKVKCAPWADGEGTDDQINAALAGVHCDNGVVTVYGARAKTYRIEVTATSDDAKTATASVTISVTQIPEKVFQGFDASYSVEVSSGSVKNKSDESAEASAKLVAKSGNSFVGYVDKDGNIGSYTGTTGAITTNKTKIEDVKAAVKVLDEYRGTAANGGGFVTGACAVAYGDYEQAGSNKKFDDAAVSIGTGDYRAFTVKFADAENNDAYYVQNAKKFQDKYFAMAGKYTITFTYTTFDKDGNHAGDVKAKPNGVVTLENDIYIPKITYNDTKVDSTDSAGIAEALKADVDIIDDESDNASIGRIFVDWTKNATTGKYEFNETPGDKTSQSTRYVEVTNKDGATVYVAYVKTFTQK